MATQSQIFDLRYKIDDPSGFIKFETVGTINDLPSVPAPQTGYFTIDTGLYLSTEKTTGATTADYEAEELMISDRQIKIWIDVSGEDQAVCIAIKQILVKLGSKF